VKVLIAPDKFKGSIDARRVAATIARGWLERRPDDDIRLLPMADGGDGTGQVIAASSTGTIWFEVVAEDAIGRSNWTTYPILQDGTAVVELASTCGLAQLPEASPARAHTHGLGMVIADAVRRGAERVMIGLGGSASTDGGVGALMALGAEFYDATRHRLKPGADLRTLRGADLSGVQPMPAGGVELLVDTLAVLTGPNGAARVFAPQKGADPAQVEALEAGLNQLATVLGGKPDMAGCGAAGGTAFGLCTGLAGRLTPGAQHIAEITGADAMLPTCDLVITGEGRYDSTSDLGKVTGLLCELAARHGVPSVVIAGATGDGKEGISLAELAGSSAESMRSPEQWILEAARRLADNPPRRASEV
jgi:glycerate kinase